MSFISILKKIAGGVETVLGDVEKVEPTVNAVLPLVETLPVFGPVAGGVISAAFSTVNSLETLITGAQQGAAKGQSGVQILQAQLPNILAAAQAIGSDAKLSPATLATVPNVVNAAVAMANAVAALEATLKAPAAPAPATANIAAPVINAPTA